MSDWQPDIVIYHDKCMDGFTAAWACWKKWGDRPEYIARNYGMDPDIDVFNRHILIVDFSFPQDVLCGLAEQGARSVVVLDHHKTAQADLAPFELKVRPPFPITHRDVEGMLRDLGELSRPAIIALFDMERSGAGMAWDFAHAGASRPKLVDLVEDRDLWRFALGEDSKLLHLKLSAGAATFSRWDIVDKNIDAALNEGISIAAYRDQLIDEIARRATGLVIDGEDGVGVDCPYGLASDVGHYLLDYWPNARFAAAIVRGEHTISYSLRSRDERADVSEIARKFGGGGHRNAAGFKVPR